jgi:hypothetical protein
MKYDKRIYGFHFIRLRSSIVHNFKTLSERFKSRNRRTALMHWAMTYGSKWVMRGELEYEFTLFGMPRGAASGFVSHCLGKWGFAEPGGEDKKPWRPSTEKAVRGTRAASYSRHP